MIAGEQSDAPDPRALNEIRTFFAAMAMALREVVAHFEETSVRVTELAAMRAGRADRNLVVALQSFDRLQQELATLADLFVLAAGKSCESWLPTADRRHSAEDALAKIPIADLRERLLRHLGIAMSDLTAPPLSEDAIF